MSEEHLVYHYMDQSGWNAIRSQIDWTFKAYQPPGDRPFGVYFTTLRIDAVKFSKSVCEKPTFGIIWRHGKESLPQ